MEPDKNSVDIQKEVKLSFRNDCQHKFTIGLKGEKYYTIVQNATKSKRLLHFPVIEHKRQGHIILASIPSPT